MDSGLILIVFGGFLIGGAWSVFRLDAETGGRTTSQVVLAVVLLVAALLATASGILRLV
ncbi:hypothetical protein SAMN05660485_02332 [Blastococcus fimeti]|nr:hypothetical protein SAMN05660485_02332 [Blastococcus fimeti]